MTSSGALRSRAVTIPLTVIAAAALLWLLQTLKSVLVPVVAAFFIALLLQPVRTWLGRRLPAGARAAALPLTMLLVVGVVAGVVWLLVIVGGAVAETAPRYESRLESLYDAAPGWTESKGLSLPENPLSSTGTRQRIGGFIAAAVRGSAMVVTGLVLIFFLTLLMLLEAPTWREKIRQVATDRHAPKAHEAVEIIGEKIRGYLWVRTLMSALSAAVEGAWLLIMGVDLVLLWVVLFFLLNYVPSVGSVIAVIPPTLLAFLQFGTGKAIVTVVGLVVLDQILGNYIDPRLQGRHLQLSALVVIVALVFWSWLWGTAGALLAVPITTALVVVARHVPGLEDAGLLLSGTADEEELDRDTRRH